MSCVNPKCYGGTRNCEALCRSCRDTRDAAVVIGVCLGMCALIVCLAKVGRLL